MGKTTKAQTPTVAAFYLKVGQFVGTSDRSGARFFRCNGNGAQIAAALNTSVLEAWHIAAAGQIGMIPRDPMKVHPHIFPKGGMTITTTDPQLIKQLSALPVDCCDEKEPHPNALKALGVEIPKPTPGYPEPAKPISVWFKFSSGTRPVLGGRGSYTNLETPTVEILRKLRDLGVIALEHLVDQSWKVTGLNVGNSRTAVGFDMGMLVLTTNHPDAARILSGYTNHAQPYSTVFEPHVRIFPIVETVEEDPDAELHTANLAKYAEQRMADAMAEEAEATKPARRSRVKATQVAVPA